MSYPYLMTLDEAREHGIISKRVHDDELRTEGEQ